MDPTLQTTGTIEVGDAVNLPGEIYGTARFIGEVSNKTVIFVGVELDQAFARKGKNSGEVDGIQYFDVAVAFSGVFVPIARVQKRVQAVSLEEAVAGQESEAALPPHLAGNQMLQAHRRDDDDTAESTARILLDYAELPLLIRARACMVLGCSEDADSLDWAEEGVRIAELANKVASKVGEVEKRLLADCKDVY
ncbi:hypothetical protein LTR08_000410 [Meristemomyces frigidus]|nr:hypothetical protein LTR08_000410 [Meristemomyces frigidus]